MKTTHIAALAAATALAPVPQAVSAMPRAETNDPMALIGQINAAVQELRETNEAQLKSKVDDALYTEKMDRIDADIGSLTKALEAAQADLAAAHLGGSAGDTLSAEAQAHADAFNVMFRKGKEPESGLRELEISAGLTTQSDPDGGYLVPDQMEGTIDRVLGTQSAVRNLSRVINISGQTYKKLVNMGGASSGWVGETEERPETATPTLREIAIEAHELYANPAATQTALDDAVFNIEQWLADEVSIEFAEQEGAAFVAGDGVKRPRGILSYDAVENDNHKWGKLGYVGTGGAAGFAAEDPADAVIDLYYALREQYRQGATFLTSDRVMGTVRKMKDGDGNYLWAPPTAAGEVATILQKPVVTDDNMPALGAGKIPMAFGNFQRGYLIVDRQGIRVLRNPYLKPPFVFFYTTKRVGGGVVNFEAIKLLKCEE